MIGQVGNSFLNSKLEFLSVFPGKFMTYQSFELSSSSVGHSGERLGGGVTVPLLPPHLVAKSLFRITKLALYACGGLAMP